MNTVFAISLSVIAGVVVVLLALVLRVLKKINGINNSVDFIDDKIDSHIEIINQLFVKNKEDLDGYFNKINDNLEDKKAEWKEEVEEISDELYELAKEVVIKAGKASASLLQRRLKVGYARAAHLLDMLEESGIIGPGDGAKPREVYIKPDGIREVGEDN